MRKIHRFINYSLPNCTELEKICRARLEEGFSNLSGILSQPPHSSSEEEARRAKEELEQTKKEQISIVLDLAAALGVTVQVWR